MNRFLLTFCFIVTFGYIYAQKNTEFVRSNFFNTGGFADAVKNLKSGDVQFSREQYTSALKYYLKANEYNPNNARLSFNIGYCYFKTNFSRIAKEHFQHAYLLNPKIDKKIHFFIGNTCQSTFRFDSAVSEYKAYINTLNPQQTEELKDAQKHIEECFVGLEMLFKPKPVIIKEIGTPVNSERPEYSPLVTPDRKQMIFTSIRTSSIGGLKRFSDDEFFEDVYISNFVDSAWQKPKNYKDINTRSNDASAGLSPDGKTLFIFRDVNGGDLLQSKFVKNKWQKSVPFPAPINSEYMECYASITADGKTLYFVSDRPDGNLGGKDIYCATMKSDSSGWEKPVNLGKAINTNYDELSVRVTPSGDTLYFSTKGHKSMGGFDLFMSTKDDKGEWMEAENLGFPINSPNDEVFYFPMDTVAYFSTVKEGSLTNFDIYMILPLRDKTKKYIAGNIDENAMNYIYSRTKGFGMNINTNVYLFAYGDYSLLSDTISEEAARKLAEEIVMEKAVLNPKKHVRIEFDYAKSNIKNKSYPILDSLANVLNKNKAFRLIITGHTDTIGSLDVNKKISLQRASSVADYLFAKKVDQPQVITVGEAFLQPIATNKTPEGRSKNRRVEFKFEKQTK